MKILKLKPLSAFRTNCYLAVSEKNNGVLIDAAQDADYILDFAKENGCEIKKILITHGHCDHIGAAAKIQQETGCSIYIHKDDAAKLSDERLNLSLYLDVPAVERVRSFDEISDGDKIILDELQFQTVHTPGHTSGCVCYICDDVMFSGDTLFYLSVGRTDMPDGSARVLSQSLKKLFSLEKDYTVYPGHGESTSLDFEKKNNPFAY